MTDTLIDFNETNPFITTRRDIGVGTAGTGRYRVGRQQGVGPCTSQMVNYRDKKTGTIRQRRRACFRRKASRPESGCLLYKKDIRDLLVTKARGAAPVKAVISHTKTERSRDPGAIVTRRADVRIGKGVIDAIHDLVLTSCDGKFAVAVLDSTVGAWAAAFDAGTTPKNPGRSTIKMAHFRQGVKLASELLNKKL
jgi:hypothetical protein